MLPPIEHRIAEELGVSPRQVISAVQLLDDGATVPFIARYRKEVTGGLDDTQLRTLEERLGYLRELEDRRASVLASIDEQGKLTPALRLEIEDADTKQRLEDLYLPYKPKRRTKAQIAREAGIGPLAEALLANPTLTPEAEAQNHVDAEAGFADAKAVLEGARQILMESFAEDAGLLGELRAYLHDYGKVRSAVVEGKAAEGAKFRDWFDFQEPIASMPSHRALALLRGRNEGVLRLRLDVDRPELATDPHAPHPCEGRIAARFGIRNQGRPADRWLADTVRWAWSVKISLHLELDLMNELRERAEEEAIRVFARNLKDLLLAAPAGSRATMGLDPGIRTGVKVAVVDATGKVVDTATVYPFEPRRDRESSLAALGNLARKHAVDLVAIGNGTASRETDALVAELIARHPDLRLTKVVVSEAGASVYSASELAAREFPGLDVSLRGAVSIARRLQDPLAELVKIDPKSIGVGQYQHDVNQSRLAKSLDAVVEDCVNAVGVDVNTASAPLLARISGLSGTLAANIVEHRDTNGPFRSRDALRDVPRLGPKTFEQAAGFLRIPSGDNPLDASSVHPEAYPVVERILARVQKNVRELMGNAGFLKSLKAAEFTDERFGLPTVVDILAELEKPGRDPRPEFRTASFREGIETLADLQPGMLLEGVVTNVTNFGAFVDIGVHQDGLVHISALSNTFVKDPHSVVKAGQVVKVKVLEVDIPRKRIALTMRLADEAAPTARKPAGGDARPPRRDGDRRPSREERTPRAQGGRRADADASGNALAAAFARARGK
ncbi:MAG: RNA-binding transcriptional accessory protein [Thauera phenolivorans]|uniref:RNA-binding transcriptional accessory protein n=1 Tax=Thauera phenolivorans TaxID=1792543 RepID=A0A7X7LW21_9RHOO|nr:RNA-binding transcriptional accessory protein [Thauera phenolivorans]